ncbi:uncharacterized protein [Amphiura filiformis]|uniref:uncharacterized protein n=1 Tax=Amphiura filiformis TaxID=82378 RepID=UPI003B212890
MASHIYTKNRLIANLLLLSMVYLSSAKEAKYLILGAGAGGLRAAEILLERGITDFLILEGTDHIGGLTQTLVEFGGITFNAGEMQLEGDRENMDSLGLDTENLGLHLTDYDNWEVRNDYGEDVTSEADTRYEEMEKIREATEELDEGVLKGERPDIDAKTAMAMKGWLARTALDKIVQWYDFDFEEGVQMKRMSMFGPYRQDLQTGESPPYYFVTDHANGLYSRIQEQLDGDHLHLNTVVLKIDQSGDKVVVSTRDITSEEEHEYIADYVLVTFGIGVLQHGEVEFNPPLPEWKTEQICRFQPASIEGILLKFASKFWSDAEWILHASDRQDVDYHHYPAFWNLDREDIHPGSNMLIAMVTGEEALRVEGLTDEEIANEVMDVLKNMYGEENVSELEDIYFKRWASDPFHYGTFTTWPIPAQVPEDAHDRLAAKFGHVYFADDAESEKDIGRLSGTLEATKTAMEKMIRCDEVEGGNCPDEYKVTPYMECEQKDGRELYGCVLIEKKEGKTRKVQDL